MNPAQSFSEEDSIDDRIKERQEFFKKNRKILKSLFKYKQDITLKESMEIIMIVEKLNSLDEFSKLCREISDTLESMNNPSKIKEMKDRYFSIIKKQLQLVLDKDEMQFPNDGMLEYILSNSKLAGKEMSQLFSKKRKAHVLEESPASAAATPSSKRTKTNSEEDTSNLPTIGTQSNPHKPNTML